VVPSSRLQGKAEPKELEGVDSDDDGLRYSNDLVEFQESHVAMILFHSFARGHP
jgi:hypothetical protein